MKIKFKLESSFNDGIDVVCKKCKELSSECKCKAIKIKILPKNKHKIKYKLNKINNKPVSSFYPFYIDNEKELLKTLKKKFGCGGNVEIIDDYIQINLQGNIIELATLELQKLGFSTI